MNKELEFTGERFTPECEREIWYEHMHRYAFARQFCRGKIVLDAACGEGFGSAMLAEVAAHVVGVDISAQSVAHAGNRYGERENLEFKASDACALDVPDGQFDVVVSFETIEHLENQEGLLAEFRRVLNDDGLLVISSPDKAEYSDRQGFENPYHVRELYRDEFLDLLKPRFPAVRLLGQALAFQSVIFDEEDLRRAICQGLSRDGEYREGRFRQPAMYLLALCAAREALLPDLSGRLWLFDDDEGSVYAHYHHEIRKNMAAGTVLAEKQAEIDALKNRLSRRPWWQRWFGRN